MRYLVSIFLALGAFISFSQGVIPEADNYPVLDTSSVLYEEDIHNEQYDHFHGEGDDEIDENTQVITDSLRTPYRDTGLVLADTIQDSLRLDSLHLSPLVKALLADSLYWINIDTNFSVFDSMAVNPYEYDVTKFKDTVEIALYRDHLGDTVAPWSMPLDTSKVNSKFGLRHYRWHYGTDLGLKIGDSVYACFDGVVRIKKFNRGGYGYYIMIRHDNGLETLYGHLSKQLVKVGERVKAGQLIGLGGNTGRSTGPHLHFEVRYHGIAMNPEDVYDFSKHSLRRPVLTINPKSFHYLVEMKKARYHRIRSGDTLGHLAVKYRTTVTRICRLNRISRNTILRIGRRVRVR